MQQSDKLGDSLKNRLANFLTTKRSLPIGKKLKQQATCIDSSDKKD